MINVRKYQFFCLVLALTAWFLLGGCTSFTTDAYKTLAVSKQTYESSLTIAGDLYRQGFVTEEQKEKAIYYGTDYMVVHNEAVAALLAYELDETPDKKQKIVAAISDALSRLSYLIDYVKRLREQ